MFNDPYPSSLFFAQNPPIFVAVDAPPRPVTL